jgi:hypothetical protein
MCPVKKENPMIKTNSASLANSLKLYEGDSGPWTNDAYMAGYLGFSDRSEYLKFLLHHRFWTYSGLAVRICCQKVG